jgi:cell division protein FtsW
MLRAGHALMLIAITLLTIGVVMVNSAALTVDAERAIDLSQVLLGRLTILAALAVVAMFAGSLVPVEWLGRGRGAGSLAWWIVIVCLVLLIVVQVPGLGREVNGARRWLNLGGMSFQPSELAKWGLLIVLAWHASRHAARMDRLFTGFVPPMIVVGAVCALIVLEDLGTAVLIGLVSVGVLLAAGSKLWHALLLAPAAGLGLLAAVIYSPYRVDRLKAFLDPYADPQGIGYHMIQSMAAVSGGGLAGRGLGNSVHKFGYLPEDTTDFIFAIICEELGLVGAAVIVFLYAALLLCGLSIVRRVAQPFQRLLGLGILLTIGLQALINIAVVTGAAPTKGIALPLLSSGGTGWVMTAFFIGLLVSMERGAEQTVTDDVPALDRPVLA